MPTSLDPLALVTAAKNRHYAYKPLAQSSGIVGQDYTPSILQGRSITQNPAAAAALAAQGVHGANKPAIQGRPASPLNPVEPTANGQVLPGFADGGEVISKVTQVIKNLLDKFGSKAVPTEVSDAEHLDLLKRYQNGQLSLEDANRLIGSLSRAPTAEQILKPAVQMPIQGLPSAQEQLRRAGSQLNAGVDPYNTADALGQQSDLDKLLPEAIAGHASGGSVDDSSLKWIADTARKLGVPSMAEDRARVATGIAKQFYGLDENGNPVLGGRAWLSSQHGTPPRLFDELTSIPGGLVKLANLITGQPRPTANTTPEEQEWMSKRFTPPAWSDEAGARLDALDKRVKEVTGVGDAQTLPEHIEDAAGMLATPLPASKVAKEAPMLQRALEYMAPVRPPTAARYATDSTALGGLGYGLDELTKKLASHKAVPEAVDPLFEQAAMDTTNQGYAGGGSTRRELLQKLAALAATVSAGPVIKTLVKDTPDVVKSEAPVATQATQMATKTPDPSMTYDRLSAIKSNVFGASDEPNWHLAMSNLQLIPGSERSQAKLAALKDHFENPSDTGEAHTHLLVNDFEHSLDELSTAHGLKPAPHPETGMTMQEHDLSNAGTTTPILDSFAEGSGGDPHVVNFRNEVRRYLEATGQSERGLTSKWMAEPESSDHPFMQMKSFKDGDLFDPLAEHLEDHL